MIKTAGGGVWGGCNVARVNKRPQPVSAAAEASGFRSPSDPRLARFARFAAI